MMLLYQIITLIVSAILFIGVWQNNKRILLPIQLCIMYALLTTGWYNIQYNPH